MQAVFVPRAIKKFWRLFRAHPAVLLALALLIALPEVSRAQTNYNRIALQRWYPADTAAAFSVPLSHCSGFRRGEHLGGK